METQQNCRKIDARARSARGANAIEALERRVLLAISPVTSSSSPSEFLDLNGIAYFTADDGVNGRNIWRSDGTESGTRIAIEHAVWDDGTIYFMQSFDDALYFVNYASETGHYSLWTSDGTPEGTRKISDHAPWYNQITKAGDTIWFMGRGDERGLYRSDGTDEGTVLVKPYNDIHFLGSIGETVIYIAHDWYPDSTHRGYFYLWASGGAAGQATLLHPDIVTHFTSYQTMRGVTLGDMFYVTRYDGLYRTDGTANSLQPVIAGNWRTLLKLDEARMLFAARATPESNVQTLWLIDDTTGGTQVLREFSTGILSQMVLANGMAYFFADDGTGNALWTSDGTVAGTHAMKYISPAYTFDLYYRLTAAQDLVYFQIEDGGVTTQWRSEGTEAGTVPIADLTGLKSYESSQTLYPVGRGAFFNASDGYSGLEPWAIGGAVEGLRLVKDINTSPLKPPAVPRLNHDTGRSAWDGVTNDNTPGFDVGSDPVARFCALYIDGVEVARDEARLGSFWFDDLPPLADGSYVITAAVAGADGVFTAQSEPLNIVIDTVAPTVSNARFSYNALGRPQISFQFSEDIFHNNPSLWLQVVDLGMGQQLPLSIDQITRDSATHTVTFTLRSFPSGLPRGRYRATLIHSRAEDLAGNVLSGDVFFDFVTRAAVAPLWPRRLLDIRLDVESARDDLRGSIVLDLLHEL